MKPTIKTIKRRSRQHIKGESRDIDSRYSRVALHIVKAGCECPGFRWHLVNSAPYCGRKVDFGSPFSVIPSAELSPLWPQLGSSIPEARQFGGSKYGRRVLAAVFEGSSQDIGGSKGLQWTGKYLVTGSIAAVHVNRGFQGSL